MPAGSSTSSGIGRLWPFRSRRNRRLRSRMLRTDRVEVCSEADGPIPRAPTETPQRPETAKRRTLNLGARLRAAVRFVGVVLLATLKVVLVLCVLTGAGVGGYLGYRKVVSSDHFRVKTITVEGTRRSRPDEVKRLVQSLIGQQIITLDLDEVRLAVESHPWVQRAVVHRELPATVVVTVEEHIPAALLLLGHLYLVDTQGQVFKRARTDEQGGLPVITGLSRIAYLNDPQASAPGLKRAIAALARYADPGRPPVSEINLGPRGELTLFLRNGGAALRFGSDLHDEQLEKLDAVLAALGPDLARLRVMFLGSKVRKDRVTVRLGSL